jgi:hypothetical protein
MKNYLTAVLIILFFILSCQRSTDPVPSLRLELQDVSCTEAWLEVTGGNGSTVIINRDGVTAREVTLTGSGAMVYDDSLLPNTAYVYQAVNPQNGQQSPALPVTTMDTSSHNFTWQVYEFGGYSSSYFNDVAIISENDIWAVGEIVTPEGDYNAAHWDGEKWELKKIKTNACGGVIYPPIKTIFSLSQSAIIFGHIDGSITYYDGFDFINDCSLIEQFNGSATKIWGTSIDNLYFISVSGFIAHYNGQEWTKIESGTELDIQDIWGSWNVKTGEYEILCVASDRFVNNGNSLFKIKNNTVIPMPTTGLPWSLKGIWFVPSRKYFICGDGLYENQALNKTWNKISFPTYYKDSIRGLDINDIIVSGSNGLLSHYNGTTWKHYMNHSLPYITGRYYGVSISDNTVTAVGYNGAKAIIVMGNR